MAAALTADPQRPTARLHLLGKGRVAVDDGDHYRQLRDVPHALRGSLVVTRGRVTRAELWIADRRNVTAAIAGASRDGRELGDGALRRQAAQTAPRVSTAIDGGWRQPAGTPPATVAATAAGGGREKKISGNHLSAFRDFQDMSSDQ